LETHDARDRPTTALVADMWMIGAIKTITVAMNMGCPDISAY
jgi:hypothetical protein